jgi:hypothetical protein
LNTNGLQVSLTVETKKQGTGYIYEYTLISNQPLTLETGWTKIIAEQEIAIYDAFSFTNVVAAFFGGGVAYADEPKTFIYANTGTNEIEVKFDFNNTTYTFDSTNHVYTWDE